MGKFRAIYFGHILKVLLRNTISGIGKPFVNQLSWAVEEGFDFLHVYLLHSESFNDTLVTRIKIYNARDKFY